MIANNGPFVYVLLTDDSLCQWSDKATPDRAEIITDSVVALRISNISNPYIRAVLKHDGQVMVGIMPSCDHIDVTVQFCASLKCEPSSIRDIHVYKRTVIAYTENSMCFMKLNVYAGSIEITYTTVHTFDHCISYASFGWRQGFIRLDDDSTYTLGNITGQISADCDPLTPTDFLGVGKVRDVICSLYYTVVLMADGKIYGRGLGETPLYNQSATSFAQIQFPDGVCISKIANICSEGDYMIYITDAGVCYYNRRGADWIRERGPIAIPIPSLIGKYVEDVFYLSSNIAVLYDGGKLGLLKGYLRNSDRHLGEAVASDLINIPVPNNECGLYIYQSPWRKYLVTSEGSVYCSHVMSGFEDGFIKIPFLGERSIATQIPTQRIASARSCVRKPQVQAPLVYTQ